MTRYKKTVVLALMIVLITFFVSLAQNTQTRVYNKARPVETLEIEDKNQSQVIKIYSSSWKGIAAASFLVSIILIYWMIKFSADFSMLENMDKVIFLYFMELLPLVNAFVYFLFYFVFHSAELITEFRSLSADYIPLGNINFTILLGMLVQVYMVNLVNLVYFKYRNIHFKAQLFIAALPLFFLVLLFLTLSFGELSILLLPVFYLIALLSPFISLLMLLKQIKYYFHGEPVFELDEPAEEECHRHDNGDSSD